MKIFKVWGLFVWSILNLDMSASAMDNYNIHSEALQGNLEFLKQNLDKSALRSKDNHSRNILFYAILSDKPECVEAIFIAACSFDKIEKFEELNTISEKSAELLKEIITTEDMHAQTPYFYAQISKNEKIRQLFNKAKELLKKVNMWNENSCILF